VLRILWQSGVLAVACALAPVTPAAAMLPAVEDGAALRAQLDAQRRRPAAPLLDRAQFVSRPAITSVVLSPNGRFVAYLRDERGTRGVWLTLVAGGAPRRLMPRTDADAVNWSGDGRWLFLVSGRDVFARSVAGPTTRRVTTLLPGGRRVFDGIDATRPAAVLVVEQVRWSGSQGWQLVRIDVRGRREVLHRDCTRIAGHALGPDGRLAWLQRVEGQALVLYRMTGPGRLQRVLRCAELRRCTPLAALGDGALLLRGDVGGDLSRLLKLGADGRLQTLHADPDGEADLDDAVLDPQTREPLVATHAVGQPRHYGLTAAARTAVDTISQALPGARLQFQTGQGPHASWLIGESSSDRQGQRWHVFDPRSRRLRLVLDDERVLGDRGRPIRALPTTALARKISLAWRASDGMRLHGLLSLPPGRDPATLPLVAHVHGGPWNHSAPGFSATVQFLVNRGFAVFEPDFRGSTGHGRRYMLAAGGDFGNGRVQQDVIDGVRAVLAQGIGDPRRVGISGASFGGYAALQGITFAPDLFKAGAALVPPPDFGWNARWITRAPEGRALSRTIAIDDWLRLAGVDVHDPATLAKLHRQSPLANVARVERPLLLMAGGEDRRVALSGVIEYAARLQVARKDVTLLIDPRAGHRNDDAVAREAALYGIETLFAAHLGGVRGAAPTGPVRDYLARNIRLSGTAFVASAD
jgi:dienelactone hydrolase